MGFSGFNDSTCQICTGNHHLNSNSSTLFLRRCCLAHLSRMTFLFDQNVIIVLNCFSINGFISCGLFGKSIFVPNSAGMWACFDRRWVGNDGKRWQQLAVMHGWPPEAYHSSPLNPLSCINYTRYSTERKKSPFYGIQYNNIKGPNSLFMTLKASPHLMSAG